jgi:hypothetical protein
MGTVVFIDHETGNEIDEGEFPFRPLAGDAVTTIFDKYRVLVSSGTWEHVGEGDDEYLRLRLTVVPCVVAVDDTTEAES